MRNQRDKLWEMMKRQAIKDIEEHGDEVIKDEGLLHAVIWLRNTQHEDKDTHPHVILEEVNLYSIFADMIIAGTTTTSNSIYAYLNILAQNPELQRKLYQYAEVDRVVSPSRSVSKLLLAITDPYQLFQDSPRLWKRSYLLLFNRVYAFLDINNKLATRIPRNYLFIAQWGYYVLAMVWWLQAAWSLCDRASISQTRTG